MTAANAPGAAADDRGNPSAARRQPALQNGAMELRRRLLPVLLALAAGLPAMARAETAVGGHGMAVFGGREALYASHLPMFHAPHDSQIVLRFHLADAAADRALREELAARPRLWTFDPETFDLLRLNPAHPQPLREFKARFFSGHFERGGKPQAGEQQVVVDEVLLFRRLDPAPRELPVGSYRLIGKGSEWFAFKVIDRRPDFDHIVRVESPGVTRDVTVPLQGLGRPRVEVLHAFRARRVTELYFETGDLR